MLFFVSFYPNHYFNLGQTVCMEQARMIIMERMRGRLFYIFILIIVKNF